MGEHTPGAWSAIKSTGSWEGHLVVPASDIEQKKERGHAICACYWAQDENGNAHYNAEANAEFIVRACNAHDDLLAAGEDVASRLRVMGTKIRAFQETFEPPESPWSRVVLDLYAKLQEANAVCEAAIAKARADA